MRNTMYKIQTLNNISRSGLDRLPANRYQVANEIVDPDAIMLRSADMHALTIPASVKAVARAGAGTNNIPVAAFSARAAFATLTPMAPKPITPRVRPASSIPTKRFFSISIA